MGLPADCYKNQEGREDTNDEALVNNEDLAQMMNIAISADVWNLELEGKGRIEKFGQEGSIG